jgi:hypothetical protein
MTPNFLVHHPTNIRVVNAKKSQKKGIPVRRQKFGDKVLFRIDQYAAHIATAAIWRVLKYVTVTPFL